MLTCVVQPSFPGNLRTPTQLTEFWWVHGVPHVIERSIFHKMDVVIYWLAITGFQLRRNEELSWVKLEVGEWSENQTQSVVEHSP